MTAISSICEHMQNAEPAVSGSNELRCCRGTRLLFLLTFDNNPGLMNRSCRHPRGGRPWENSSIFCKARWIF